MRSAIGVDIGGTNIKFVHVSEKGDILKARTEPTPDAHGDSPENIKRVLIDCLKEMLHGEKPSGIGFGIAGIIDRKKGVVIESPNIPALNNFAVMSELGKEFSLPLVMENDANACAYAEKWLGAGRSYDDFVLLTLGTGIGGGIIYKGELFEGAAEIGHIVIEPDGRFCTCRSFGCLESYAAGRAIVDRTISALEKGVESIIKESCGGNFYKVTPELVYRTALEGDNLSREVFREAGRYLGIGIANLVNIFSPEAVIIGGGLIGAWDLFIEELTREFIKRAFKPLSANIAIIKALLQKDSGSIGAAGLLLNTAKQTAFS
jgi:glucokinase